MLLKKEYLRRKKDRRKAETELKERSIPQPVQNSSSSINGRKGLNVVGKMRLSVNLSIHLHTRLEAGAGDSSQVLVSNNNKSEHEPSAGNVDGRISQSSIQIARQDVLFKKRRFDSNNLVEEVEFSIPLERTVSADKAMAMICKFRE